MWITTNWKILKEMGIPDHLTCLLRNLYVDQEATVRTLYGTIGCFKIEKGVQQCSLLSPCLFNVYAEYIMRNAGLDELQAGIKISGRNINKLRMTTTWWYHSNGRKQRGTKEPLFLFVLFFVCFFLIFIFTLFYFTILYWFCHTLTWIPLDEGKGGEWKS